MAEVDPEWEGGCLSLPPDVLPPNSFPWYVFQRNITQWDYISGMAVSKVSLKYDPVMKFVEQGGYRGADFFDVMERIQILELEYLQVYRAEQQLEEERRAAEEEQKALRERVEAQQGEDLPRRGSEAIGQRR